MIYTHQSSTDDGQSWSINQATSALTPVPASQEFSTLSKEARLDLWWAHNVRNGNIEATIYPMPRDFNPESIDILPPPSSRHELADTDIPADFDKIWQSPSSANGSSSPSTYAARASSFDSLQSNALPPMDSRINVPDHDSQEECKSRQRQRVGYVSGGRGSLVTENSSTSQETLISNANQYTRPSYTLPPPHK